MHVECVNGPALTDVTPEHGQGLQRMHNFGGSSRGSNGRCSPPNATYRIFSSSTRKARLFVVEIRTEGACW
jgi:hypothetical protein